MSGTEIKHVVNAVVMGLFQRITLLVVGTWALVGMFSMGLVYAILAIYTGRTETLVVLVSGLNDTLGKLTLMISQENTQK
jgi:hypothetical protein